MIRPKILKQHIPEHYKDLGVNVGLHGCALVDITDEYYALVDELKEEKKRNELVKFKDDFISLCEEDKKFLMRLAKNMLALQSKK